MEFFFPAVSTWPRWARRAFVIGAPVTVPLYILGWLVFAIGCVVSAFIQWLTLLWV